MQAAFGRGCQHCEPGVPVEKIKSRTGFIRLCLECVLLWFPGRTVDWWEERHAPMADHVSDAVERAYQRGYEQAVLAGSMKR